MGQAARRGSLEVRKRLSIQKEVDRLNTIEAHKQMLFQREIDAYKIMVWWQIDLSEERYHRIMKRKYKRDRDLAQLAGLLYSTFDYQYGAFDYFNKMK
jgi:hypothetical protein